MFPSFEIGRGDSLLHFYTSLEVPDVRRFPLATNDPAQSLGYPYLFVRQLGAVHQLTTTRLASQYAAMQDEARLG
jgi:hypothetical protein